MIVDWLPEDILATTKREFKGQTMMLTVLESASSECYDIPDKCIQEIYGGLVAGAAFSCILNVPYASKINQVHYADKAIAARQRKREFFGDGGLESLFDGSDLVSNTALCQGLEATGMMG